VLKIISAFVGVFTNKADENFVGKNTTKGGNQNDEKNIKPIPAPQPF
jgi:hypothetical protein